jgi:hypothetical protein
MTPQFIPKIIERYIAIDHACGWPNLTLLPGGEIAALVWPEPCHGEWEGAAECWVSPDDGRTWAKRGVPVPHTPGTNRMNLAAGLARDGALVALVAGWDGRTPRGIPTSHAGHHMTPPVPARSRDGGRTWENFPAPAAPAGELGARYGEGERFGDAAGGPGLTPFGDIWPLGDGLLGAMFYTSRVRFYVSADEGRTWTHRAGLGDPDRLNETTWLPLPDGRLLAAARTTGEHQQRLELFSSADQGHTWRFEQALTGCNEHPAALTLLQDGSVLLTYGIRTEPLFGIGARLSRDGGRTWSEPQLLVDLERASNLHCARPEWRDAGYPANVQVSDGTIVTAYYCKGVSAHQRYHVGVVRWRL